MSAKRVEISILILFLFSAALTLADAKSTLKSLLQGEYPRDELVSISKGNFTGSDCDEYLAFYQKPSVEGLKDSSKMVWGVVFLVRDGHVKTKYDLEYHGLSTLALEKNQLKIVRNPSFSFGRWVSNAYVGDFNRNGLDEILFFELSGMSFLPSIIEYQSGEFVNVLSFQTPHNLLSGIETVVRNGDTLLKLYGYGNGDRPVVRGDWYLYEWNAGAKRYEVVDQKKG